MRRERDYRDIVGRGLAFPLDVDSSGQVRWSVPLRDPTDADRVNAVVGRLRHLVLTVAGQRVLRREYGTRIVSSLFGLVQPALIATILRRALLAIQRWEPRVTIVGADTALNAERGIVVYVLRWIIAASGQRGEAVVPIGLDFKEAP